MNLHHGKGLTPLQDERGEWQYNRDEVVRLAAVLRARGKKPGPKPRAPGDVAREAFKMFSLGLPLDAVVQQLSVEPEKVVAWREIYDRGYSKPVRELTPEQQLALEKHRDRIKLETAHLEFEREKLYENSRRRKAAGE